jgi:molybdate transport system substrate-binding protein
VAMFVLLSTACGGGDSKELLVFAATSLTDALTEIENAYESESGVDVLISYGGSQSLARQIESGAPANVFISAGDGPVALLEDAGLVAQDSSRSLLLNHLVLVARSGVRGPESLSDLRRDEYARIAIADPNLAPAGAYARESLIDQGIWDAIQGKVVFGADVRVTLTYVETGNADVALVYATDAATTPDLSALDIVPEGSYVPIVYPAVAISGSDDVEIAKEFIEFMRSPSSVEIFRRYGFEPAP